MPVFLALVASSQSCHALRIGNTLPAHAMARTMIPKMAPCVGISAAMPMPTLTPRLAPRMHAPIVPDILFPWFWNAQMMQEPQETVPKENDVHPTITELVIKLKTARTFPASVLSAKFMETGTEFGFKSVPSLRSDSRNLRNRISYGLFPQEMVDATAWDPKSLRDISGLRIVVLDRQHKVYEVQIGEVLDPESAGHEHLGPYIA